MPYFFHYTDEEGARNIIKSGKIMSSASLKFMASGDTPYENGVYLTKLDPLTSTKSEIAKNNWMKTSDSYTKKTNNYFVIDIPDYDVKDTKTTDRSIFLFGKRNDLLLVKYSWWLKDFDSDRIIASYKYKVTSLGPASSFHGSIIGDYRMTEDTVNGRPVYKAGVYYLFMSSKGRWTVGPNFGDDNGCLLQRSKYSLGPVSNLPWEYLAKGKYFFSQDKWSKEDDTLKADAWQV